jgi:hypothetical protein
MSWSTLNRPMIPAVDALGDFFKGARPRGNVPRGDVRLIATDGAVFQSTALMFTYHHFAWPFVGCRFCEFVSGDRRLSTRPNVFSQASTHGREQRFGIDRFPEDAEILCFDEIAGIAADDHDRNVTCAAARCDLLLHEHAIETGQREIEHNEIGRLRFDDPKRVETVADVIDVEACDGERRAVQVSKLGIILDYEDSLAR